MAKDDDKIIKEDIDDIKTFNTKVHDVYDDCLIIMVEGWRMSVYYDLSFKDLEWVREHKGALKGRNIDINYIGDLKDPHSLKYLPIKSLE